MNSLINSVISLDPSIGILSLTCWRSLRALTTLKAVQVVVLCPVTNRGCNFSQFLNSTPSYANVASSNAQSKKDHLPGLRKGPGSISYLRSPNS
ncbi:hypothetical protein TNCV_220801 [Trichonephila clavipes]|nr:hypothetical protein TNCV_220801 [Trichonephila clavipes]